MTFSKRTGQIFSRKSRASHLSLYFLPPFLDPSSFKMPLRCLSPVLPVKAKRTLSSQTGPHSQKLGSCLHSFSSIPLCHSRLHPSRSLPSLLSLFFLYFLQYLLLTFTSRLVEHAASQRRSNYWTHIITTLCCTEQRCHLLLTSLTNVDSDVYADRLIYAGNMVLLAHCQVLKYSSSLTALTACNKFNHSLAAIHLLLCVCVETRVCGV